MLAAAHSNTVKLCSIEGCNKPHVSRGFCRNHYRQARTRGLPLAEPVIYPPLCTADGCSRETDKGGYCQMHYRRMQRTGNLGRVRREVGSEQPRSDGYIDQLVDGKRNLQHIQIAERALGKPLPPKAEVHHVNEIRSDNRPENLVICPDRQYHTILHARTRALDACGHADWRKCAYCHQYDDLANMTCHASRGQLLNKFYHKACAAKYFRDKKAAKSA